jgi:hypothetical protein
MARIICDADPFCYGPAATLLAVVKCLITSGHHITFIGTGTALELVGRQAGISVIPCDTASTTACLQALEVVGGADLLLSVLGNASIRAASERRIPVAYVDVLFWVWPSAVEEHLRNADMYFIENDFESADKLNRMKEVIRNPFLVGPIIDTSFSSTMNKGNELLISYGGVDSPATRSGLDTQYHITMTQLLLEALESGNPFSRVWVAAGERAVDGLKRQFSATAVQFVSLSHEDFLRRLSVSRCLLTQPGLSTPLESFAYGTPTFFLPPMNYSQVLQLRRFEAEGVAPYNLSWDSLDPEYLIPEDLPEAEGVAEVLARISKLKNDNYWRGRVRNGISDFVSLPPSTVERVITLQSGFYNSLGPNGATTISDVINRYLS